MKFGPSGRLQTAALVGVLIVTACGGATVEPPATTTLPTVTTDSPVQQPDPDPGIDAPILHWDDPSRTTDLGGGWSAVACQGEAPLICVRKDGSASGHLEAIAYPIDSFPDLNPEADAEANLGLFAEGFFEALSADREAGCGSDYVFAAIEPEPFVLANTPGIVFGFEGRMGNGQPSEYNLQYATIVDSTIISIVAAAYDEGGCPGRDDLSGFTSRDLIEFRPHLEPALYESALPTS